MIVLHHCHETRSMRVLWLLNELGADFELRVHPFDKSLREKAYLNLSPAGRVPALEFDGEVLFESGAILQVLCARHPENRLGRLQGDPEWGEWLVWLHFAETLSQHTAALTQQHIALYEDHMRSPTVMKLEAARIGKCFDAIETRLGSTPAQRDYLLDSGFSVADIAVGQAVYMALHFVRPDKWPKLAAWYERITSRPPFIAALPSDDAERLYRQEFYEAWSG
ncbi:MAG: glutathione S-transferase family protein [Boseongicola sp.]